LRYIIQDALGWTNSHLHEFVIGQQCYALHVSPIGDDVDTSREDADAVTLAEVLARQIKRFGYTYDFGDSWDHVINVEALLPAEPDQHYPQCTGGARTAPPEDCGGM